MICDYQQCGNLASVDSDESVQPSFKLKYSKCCSVSSLIVRMVKRFAKVLTRLRVCTGWSEPLLVAHTTLLDISCHGSYRQVHDVLVFITCMQTPTINIDADGRFHG